jgi:hypothetical protein
MAGVFGKNTVLISRSWRFPLLLSCRKRTAASGSLQLSTRTRTPTKKIDAYGTARTRRAFLRSRTEAHLPAEVGSSTRRANPCHPVRPTFTQRRPAPPRRHVRGATCRQAPLPPPQSGRSGAGATPACALPRGLQAASRSRRLSGESDTSTLGRVISLPTPARPARGAGFPDWPSAPRVLGGPGRPTNALAGCLSRTAGPSAGQAEAALALLRL